MRRRGRYRARIGFFYDLNRLVEVSISLRGWKSAIDVIDAVDDATIAVEKATNKANNERNNVGDAVIVAARAMVSVTQFGTFVACYVVNVSVLPYAAMKVRWIPRTQQLRCLLESLLMSILLKNLRPSYSY